MRKTNTMEIENKIMVSVENLAKMLDCGRVTAVRIGTEAGARVQIGKRVLFKMDKIERYLDSLAEG